MPVPFTAAQIKAWFETGDVPTQQQFADLVDTMFHMVQQAQDDAAAAAALAERASQCFGLITIGYNHNSPSIATLTVNRVQDCAVAATFAYASNVSNRIVTATITITPEENFADTNYVALISREGDDGSGDENTPSLTRNLASLVLTVKFTFTASFLAGNQSRKISFDVKP